MIYFFKKTFRLVAATLITLTLCPITSAQNGTADVVFPQIGQPGTKVKVWMRGTHLETAEEVLFYKPGIRCTGIEPLSEVPHDQTGKPNRVDPGTAIALTLQIAPDAECGEYFLRVRTRKKLSELLSFWVTPFPVIDEKSPYWDTMDSGNGTPARSQSIPMNSTVVGYHPAGGGPLGANDLDCYRVTLKKGQLCTAQILNARLGTHHYGGLTDMAIEVRSPSDKRIARADDSPLLAQDPVVSFIAPEPGVYTITVRQQMDSEEPIRHYGLHIGDFPRPLVTYPLGGQIGKNLDLRVFFADGSQKNIEAKLPEKIGEYEDSLVELTKVADYSSPIPSPNLLKVANFPNVFEAEGHGKPENAQVVTKPLPLALNGIIKQEGEKDWFRFHAKKGEHYRVRAYSRTLGSKLDPFVWIKPAEGNPSKRLYEEDDSLWDGHDWEGHHYRHQVKDRLDPVFMFEPDEDGDYLLGVGDTRREFGDDYIYRIEIQPHRDSIFSYYTPYPSQSEIVRDVIAVHRGSSLTRPISIQNGFGSRYEGSMKLEAVGLPKGITFECPVFTKNDPIILASLTAPADAPLGATLFELVPRALEKGVDLGGTFAHTSAATDRRGGFAMVFNKTRKLAFAVLDEAPFEVEIEQPKIGLAKNAELDLKVNVRRKGAFKGALYLEMDWLPKGINKQPPLVIAEGKTSGIYKLSASRQAVAGKSRLSITARENEGGNPRNGVGFHYIASPMITVEVLDPYLEIELQRAAIEQGATGEIVGMIKHLRPFNGEATAKLLRLPNGVTLASEPKIKPGEATVTFSVNVAPDALTGQYKELACDIAIIDAGQSIHQQTGSGILRIDPRRSGGG